MQFICGSLRSVIAVCVNSILLVLGMVWYVIMVSPHDSGGTQLFEMTGFMGDLQFLKKSGETSHMLWGDL